jgi:inner membrane transporter RhtA
MEGATATAASRRLALPAPALVVAGALSTQLGAALADHAFARVGPVGAAAGRAAFAAAALALLTRASRGSRTRLREHWRPVAVLGAALACMNTLFYLGLDRLPLGVAVTLEFWGPIGLAVAMTHRRRDLVWAGLALAGVALLGGGLSGSEALGVALVLAAGGAWAVYIVAARRVALRFEASAGLSSAMLVAALALAPLGLASAGRALLEPATLALLAGVGLLASAIPFALDQIALRRVPPRTYGVLVSLHPAVAAVVGAVALSQQLRPRDLAGIAAVTLAAAGAMRAAAPVDDAVEAATP